MKDNDRNSHRLAGTKEMQGPGAEKEHSLSPGTEKGHSLVGNWGCFAILVILSYH